MAPHSATPAAVNLSADSASRRFPLSPGVPLPWELAIVVRAGPSGPELLRVPVPDADVLDLRSEMWRDGLLRRGFSGAPLEAAPVRLELRLESGGGERVAALALEVDDPRGETMRRELSIDAFRDAALVAAEQLIESGSLPDGEAFHYEVLARRRDAGEPPHDSSGRVADAPAAAPAAGSSALAAPPLALLVEPLAPLLAGARVIGELDDEAFPVLYVEAALEKAERFSRQGGEAHPPVETGAVLAGWLCSCPSSGELYVVIADAIEASDAEQGKFSLSYTGKTWVRIQAVMRARQRAAGSGALRLVGQSHGHNWMPEGGPPCADCARLKVCRRTTAFASLADRIWSRAVFCRQPWQLCHIFGLNARQDRVQGLFTLAGNRLRERGFHVIPQFDPGPAPGTGVSP